MKRLILLFCATLLLLGVGVTPRAGALEVSEEAKDAEPPIKKSSRVSPLAVGFGNTFVPGLGATLRGEPTRGLLEASAEIGLIYGGTFNVREDSPTIDGSVVIPNSNNIDRPLIGQTLQQFGIKLHMYDTFYHYQQAARANRDDPHELENPQPLYQGEASDILTAPFRFKNLSEPLVLGSIALGGAYLIHAYQSTPVQRHNFSATTGQDRFYAANQVAIIPFGGVLGEEPLFRGFIQRELRGYTHSLWLSVLGQTAMFVAIHPDELKLGALSGGIVYGLMTEYYHGDLGPSIAAHFWLNVVDGLIAYWTFRRVQGQDTPFAPPIEAQFTIPF